MAPDSSTLFILLSFALCLSSTYGRIIREEDQDIDDDWPVLCPPDTFYSRDQELCLTCSRCPINNIIMSPCQGLHDTKCGPFYDFSGLVPSDGDLAIDDNDNKSEQQNGGKDHFWLTSKDSVNKLDLLDSQNVQSESTSRHTSLDEVEYSDSEWKSLTIALIVLVSVFLVIVIVGVVFFLRRKRLSEKQIVCEYSPAPGQAFV